MRESGGCSPTPVRRLRSRSNTHELVLRFLSALPLRERPKLVTTDGEFHTLRRQLGRLAEEGLEVARLPARPVETLAERLADEAPGASAVLVSAVLFEDSRIVPELPALAAACADAGAELLVDAYHALGCLPFTIAGLERAWIVGGGYKYLQLGEGNCFLRLPPQADELRPAVTGWFAEFEELHASHEPGATEYPRGSMRFAGSTYDPTSHYRAARVLDFFEEQGLTPERLRESYLAQTTLLAERFDALELDDVTRPRDAPLEAFGGFLALESERAEELSRRLLDAGVVTDSRGTYLRLGPAPYHSDAAARCSGRTARTGRPLLGRARHGPRLDERRGPGGKKHHHEARQRDARELRGGERLAEGEVAHEDGDDGERELGDRGDRRRRALQAVVVEEQGDETRDEREQRDVHHVVPGRKGRRAEDEDGDERGRQSECEPRRSHLLERKPQSQEAAQDGAERPEARRSECEERRLRALERDVERTGKHRQPHPRKAAEEEEAEPGPWTLTEDRGSQQHGDERLDLLQDDRRHRVAAHEGLGEENRRQRRRSRSDDNGCGDVAGPRAPQRRKRGDDDGEHDRDEDEVLSEDDRRRLCRVREWLAQQRVGSPQPRRDGDRDDTHRRGTHCPAHRPGF